MNPEATLFCSHYSKSVGEPLFGTAPRTDVWILIEYPFAYAAKAFEDCDLSEPVKNHLGAFQQNIPNSRLLFIKKQSDQKERNSHLFLAVSNEANPRMHRFELKTYKDILTLDFSAIVDDAAIYSGNRYLKPVFLVCTHGKRDRCCAKYGLPLYENLSNLAPETTWQSSHVGGHRFAPNVIYLPSGIYYGRFTGEEAGRLAASANAGKILIDHYRGRACYPPEVQAAEFYLRSQTGIDADNAYHLIETSSTQKDIWKVAFKTNTGSINLVQISTELSEYAIIEGCNLPEKRNPQPIYHLMDIKHFESREGQY